MTDKFTLEEQLRCSAYAFAEANRPPLDEEDDYDDDDDDENEQTDVPVPMDWEQAGPPESYQIPVPMDWEWDPSRMDWEPSPAVLSDIEIVLALLEAAGL